ncbi:2-amino-4-hydroxy-6-hydroxymethyldihydropteridine diphosphokinase [Frankia sp. CNm7]|uniref:2-amino-4-hydroxy-6-hydroxymethyldihydropteridine diphosphokinase n=1 Tax=Frankia nepalensis TaxID=1836974 RepID=A0A937URP2_9ACTN|nr:2-amino-4-hydroxy-6-hydroxymethyldihydropteridine diphosphokinase [Frankia nepalensis]MBL7512676.1 2-amino-4-hydroxy-6-hydroxymethyldihydropteridine diphosphokinase [Frankia nepalensis]MBL7520858.1 2-amino-4-hydroxy-6-hydroxymethyldihydropteridine diphosphokinase [Frankia nepalensis]MBL7631333.1 2-amino-4-hydroxy-6-hydroxymethyldihydropteridine diphosphokinase [Frankia nepalensis]
MLALGSNLGDREATLRAAVTLLDERLGVLAASPLYETVPVGGPPQDDYLNAVLLTRPAPPRELLEAAREAERAADRVRVVRWGPRTLDVDVIACGETVSDDPEILVPHPRAHLRAFVCVPWLDVDPDATIPGHGRVADLVAGLAAAGEPTSRIGSANPAGTLAGLRRVAEAPAGPAPAGALAAPATWEAGWLAPDRGAGRVGG